MKHSSCHGADRPRRPVLFVNPRSGGGKATRAGLAERARELGVDVIVLRPDDDLAALVDDAVARGADALGAAGGDGSLAVVAAAALAHGLPFVCVPAGTRNHFALDVGVDRGDLVGSLEAFADGVERRIDVAEVNGRLFLNNVSLGIYGDAVRQPAYRDAKARTLAQTAAQVLGPSAPAAGLELVDDRGRAHRDPAVVLVSNNPYSFDPPRAPGTRPALDSGQLGVVVLDRPAAGQSPGTDVDLRAARDHRPRARSRRNRRRGGRAHPAAPVRDPVGSAPRQDPVASRDRVRPEKRRNPPTVRSAGFGRRRRRASSGDVELLLQLANAFLDTGAQLGLTLLSDCAARSARGGVGGVLRRLELAHDLSDRAAGHLAVELLHLAVDHLDRRLLHARDHGRRSRRDRLAEP